MTFTIIHNKKCSKSRLGLKYLEEKNISPKIRLYLEDKLSKEELKEILKQLDIEPINLVRKNEIDYKELKKQNQNPDNETLINWMIEYPKLIQRPIIINHLTKKAVIARPTEEIDKIV